MTHDSTPLPVYRLTEHYRLLICAHEAAHAVVAALGDRQCRGMAVAPVGAEEWTPVAHSGKRLDASWGYCTTYPVPRPLSCLKWDPETCEEGYDLTLAKRYQKQWLAKTVFRTGYYRGLRAWLCESLAGPIVDGYLLGKEPWLESDYTRPDDINQAQACCDLLPFRNQREFNHAVYLTTDALCNHWSAVLALTEALAQAGTLDEDAIRPYLPPSLKGWPTPPPRRRFA